ncbi:hypothetical protein ACOSQ2_022539 [Xanthoceras sorbifolium]
MVEAKSKTCERTNLKPHQPSFTKELGIQDPQPRARENHHSETDHTTSTSAHCQWIEEESAGRGTIPPISMKMPRSRDDRGQNQQRNNIPEQTRSQPTKKEGWEGTARKEIQ